MTFTLQTGNYFYSDKDYIKELMELGFTFKPYAESEKVYCIKGSPTIEIDCLEDLMSFINKFGRCVIDEDTITIYDGYLE